MLKKNPALVNALAFAVRGYPVLPLHGITERDGQRGCSCGTAECSSPGKHPFTRLAPHGLKDATTDVTAIKTWFAEQAWLNYGVSTDTLPTVDIDPRNGGDAAWLKLVRENYLPHSWEVVTGGDGKHIIFGATSAPVPSGKLARGVDVKGIGGYIVGAGSLHASGKRYCWSPQCRPSEVELAAPPKWILDKLKTSKERNGEPRSPQYYHHLVEPILEGERNEKLTALFGHLYGSAFPNRAMLLTLVLCFNRVRVEPPLSDDEVIRIALSIKQREDRKGHDRRSS